MIEEPVDARSVGERTASSSGPSRARRLVAGWSANLFQIILGITQQVVLVPVFLHFWSSQLLAAWLVLYAVGNLVPIADCGLQLRAINRFLTFKSKFDCDGRTAQYFAAMLRIYIGITVLLVALLLMAVQFLSPSAVFGFRGTPQFDAAFAIMAVGTLLALPSNLLSGLYRARGRYGRAVNVQSAGTLLGQICQLAAIAATGSLLAVTAAYAAAQVATAAYFFLIDAPRLFPFLRWGRATHSWRWIIGQLRQAAPFAVAGATELALLNLPVLLVSALVSDRVAVVQWGLTRVAAGLLRALGVQATLPLSAELGHDYAVGLKEPLRHLYARGSVLVSLLASLIVSGLLPFWPDFFALWTRGAVPDDPALTITLLIGAVAVAPSILALGYANYSNRGDLLVRTKGLQLAVFLALSAVLIPAKGPFGAALAIVASDLLVQAGVLGLVILGQTLQAPLRHLVFVAAVMTFVVLAGWGLGLAIRLATPWTGLAHFTAECSLWLVAVALAASPLLKKSIRTRLIAAIPR